MAKITVGVLRGGPSAEHEISLKTGWNVLNFLPEKYRGVDIVLNKEGKIFEDGEPSNIRRLNHSVDVIFNALHGYFGEDGKAQHIFDSINIPYTGSGALASALGMNKVLSRDIFRKAGLKIPRTIVIKKEEPMREAALGVFRNISPPWVIKPASGGSSIGVSIVHDFSDFVSAIEKAFTLDSTVLAEEYIKGREATCGILDNFRGEEHYALPAIEIIPACAKVSAGKPPFFDYEGKYSGSTGEICPATFELPVKREIENMARLGHRALGCRGYSRLDMIVSTKGIYLLELNTLPGLTGESLFPKAAEAVGLEFPRLLEHIIDLALNRHKWVGSSIEQGAK